MYNRDLTQSDKSSSELKTPSLRFPQGDLSTQLFEHKPNSIALI